MSKRLAIMFFGCMRTYELTYESFFENIVKANEKQGYEIDIFIHTWDIFEKGGYAWHSKKGSPFGVSFPTLDGKKITQEDIDKILKIYSPKKFTIETLGDFHGGTISRAKVSELVGAYEQEKGFKYDYYLVTRPDLFFKNPFVLDAYFNEFNWCNKYSNKYPKNVTFLAHNPYVRSKIIDMRYICEGDMLYFANFLFKETEPFRVKDNYLVLTNYLLYRDFFMQREIGLYKADCVWNRIEKLQSQLYEIKTPTAKTRIKSQLSYKLGEAMIANSKSFKGLLRMPYVLSYIAELHKKEQKAYNEKLALNPNLKLPPLESYSDYKEALKLKNHLSYKLGNAFIKAYKNFWGGD